MLTGSNLPYCIRIFGVHDTRPLNSSTYNLDVIVIKKIIMPVKINVIRFQICLTKANTVKSVINEYFSVVCDGFNKQIEKLHNNWKFN